VNGPGIPPRAGHRQCQDTATAEELAAEVWGLELSLIRVIRDEHLAPADRQRAVTDLFERGRSSDEPEVCLRAMEWAIGRDIDELTDQDPGPGDPVERRLLQLHQSGETTCGRCLRPVPHPLVLGWWRTRRMAMTWRPEEAA
jgi:hypothetical protein